MNPRPVGLGGTAWIAVSLASVSLPGPLCGLLRNSDRTDLNPPTPPRDFVLPLDPARDAYLWTIQDGDLDPDPGVLDELARPLVIYGIDGCDEIYLTKAPGRRVQVYF